MFSCLSFLLPHYLFLSLRSLLTSSTLFLTPCLSIALILEGHVENTSISFPTHLHLFWRFLSQTIYFVYLFTFLYVLFHRVFVTFIGNSCNQFIFLIPPEAMNSESFHDQSQVSLIFLSIFFTPSIDLLNNRTPSH